MPKIDWGFCWHRPIGQHSHWEDESKFAFSATFPFVQMVPGVNLGYKVQLWNGTSDSQPVLTERLNPAVGRIQRTLGGLKKYGHYNLTVLCFTAPGDGPKSEPVEFRTAEDLPGPVGGLGEGEG